MGEKTTNGMVGRWEGDTPSGIKYYVIEENQNPVDESFRYTAHFGVVGSLPIDTFVTDGDRVRAWSRNLENAGFTFKQGEWFLAGETVEIEEGVLTGDDDSKSFKEWLGV